MSFEHTSDMWKNILWVVVGKTLVVRSVVKFSTVVIMENEYLMVLFLS